MAEQSTSIRSLKHLDVASSPPDETPIPIPTNNDSEDHEAGNIEQQHEKLLVQTADDDINNLEDRLVDALDALKLATSNYDLQVRNVFELCAFAGTNLAAKFQDDDLIIEAYERLNEQLCLPTMLEIAQSDARIARRCAALGFFQAFAKEMKQQWASDKSIFNRREKVWLAERMDELLQMWVRASIGCLVEGVFTQSSAESAVASKGVLSANAAIRPVFWSISRSIDAADDEGALALFRPAMMMIAGVCRKFFLSEDDNLRASCVKFLETVVLCFSSKGNMVGSGRRNSSKINQKDDFSLTDLPTGHPKITREALESVAHFAFIVLRGLVEVGGQMSCTLPPTYSNGEEGFTVEHLISSIKPAALVYLEVDSNRNANDDKIDRRGLEVSFYLSQKSFAITVNAVAIIAINRAPFFKDAARTLSRRAIDPPSTSSSEGLNKAAVLGVNSQLRASCLTLLRNPLSVTSSAADILVRALKHVGMTVQADKAHNAAKQQAALKTASRKVRNRAAVFYEWDQSEMERTTKRQRETDDALAQLRAERKAKGLGNGIQLPNNLIESCELVLQNLTNIPATRPTQSKKGRTITLDYVVDAIMSNGASLKRDAGRWYDRDGGEAWSCEVSNSLVRLDLSENVFTEESGRELYSKQCRQAAADAFTRIVSWGDFHHQVDKPLSALRDQISARLACTLKGVKPPKTSPLSTSHELALKSIASTDLLETQTRNSLTKLLHEYPLVAACLALEYAKPLSTALSSNEGPSLSLMKQVLIETYLQQTSESYVGMSDKSNNILFACMSYICKVANEKPTDLEQKKIASVVHKTMPLIMSGIPVVSKCTLQLLSSLCDVDAIHKALADISKKSSSTIAASAAAHAATRAAEARAETTLLALKDMAFDRTKTSTRQAAIDCAVALATGHFPSPVSVQNKAQKLVINILFLRSPTHADMVITAATIELNRATELVVASNAKVEAANKSFLDLQRNGDEFVENPLQPFSAEEKEVMDRIQPTTELFMAICVRRPDAIRVLMDCSCRENAELLLKTVKSGISKLVKASSLAYGSATIALKVADMAKKDNEQFLIAFIDHLAPSSIAEIPSQPLVDACFKIQEDKAGQDGSKNPSYIIPVVSALKRSKLVELLPNFVRAESQVYRRALLRMSEKLGRENTIFRDEHQESESSTFLGMTRCEQLVFLHKLDFRALGLPQKTYLDGIRQILDMENIFTDKILHGALDHMSRLFLLGESLPLAYMRTIIQVCQRRETLHNWICSDLLPRLLEGKIFNDRRQWEGWMRAVRILEKNVGVNSLFAISKLPEAQLQMYRSKYPA